MFYSVDQSYTYLESPSFISSMDRGPSVNSEVPAFCPEQFSTQESFLDPKAPAVVPEQSSVIENPESMSENLDVGMQTLAESPVGNSLTICAEPTSSTRIVNPLLKCPNVDDDVTLLKRKFDPGGSSYNVEMEISEESSLPEHVHALFVQTFEQSDFPVESADGLKQLVFYHRNTFASFLSDLGYCTILKHHIDTRDAQPIRQAPRKPSLAAPDAEGSTRSQRKMLVRFRIFKTLWIIFVEPSTSLPLTPYWQLGMTERAKERSAFCTRRGLFQFTRMPFGLSGGPGSFCRLMPIVLRDLLCMSLLP